MASSAGAEPTSLGWAEARARVLQAVSPLAAERMPLERARGRALRETVAAAHALPPFRNSSMDGFAVRSTDLAGASEARPLELPVGAVIAAGHVAERPLGVREAMRIMTGAALPEGADAVVPFEDAETAGDRVVRLRTSPATGENVRDAGADVAAGEPVLGEGRELSPHDLALLAALGRAEVLVGPAPRAAVISTGDELLDPDEPLRPGAIRDSNVPLLRALLEEAGCRVTTAERVADDPATLVARVREAVSDADVVLTIGGVSAGDFDPVKRALREIGDVALWRVAMKPGRPQAFGRAGDALFFGLPGNPASVACVFEAIVRPALRALQGFTTLDRPRLGVRVEDRVESRAGRTDFVRATLERREGEWWASPAGAQISGHLMPQSRAHVLVVVPEAVAALAPGDRAEALLLRWPDPDGR